MRKVFSVFLVLCVFSLPAFAVDTKHLVRGLALVAGIVAIERISNPPERFSAEPARTIDRACVKIAVTGNESTVAIRSIRGASWYPVRDKLTLALQGAGYTVLGPQQEISRETHREIGNGGTALSEFISRNSDGGPGYESGDLPAADYYLELTVSWVRGEEDFRHLAGSTYGYYGSYSRGRTSGELRISIVMFDSSGRAVPGKASEAKVNLSLQESRRGTLISYYFGDMGGSFRELADPATEAAIRVIPQMFASNN